MIHAQAMLQPSRQSIPLATWRASLCPQLQVAHSASAGLVIVGPLPAGHLTTFAEPLSLTHKYIRQKGCGLDVWGHLTLLPIQTTNDDFLS